MVSFTNDSQIRISIPNSGIGTVQRFPYGSYIQIDEEIMRVASSTLGGTNNDEITVIRGALATRKVSHDNGSLIRKIKPIPIEYHRPSIIRASGHTFEYLGYGPGNYSTGLPQIQIKSLSEREEFLVQSQERKGGIVVYTGMNNRGDFFVGNQKKTSTTGEEVTFDTPVPTVTGEDPSRLSVVFDEVTVKERLVVEGGNSNTVLSQFDGPVTFNKEINFNDIVNLRDPTKIADDTQSTTSKTGSLTTKGGVGIEKNLNVGGTLSVTGVSTFTALLDANGGATINNVRVGVAGDNEIDTSTGGLTLDSASGTTTVDDNLSVTANLSIVGVATFASLLDANAGATIDNVRIGITNDNTIDTSTGNLVIDSTGGTTTIDDNLIVTNTLSVNGNTTLGDASTDTTTVNGNLYVTQDIVAFYTSDQRLKDNIIPIDDPLAKVLSISGNTYDWNEKSNKSGHDVGVIAQEIQSVLPEAVIERDNGYLAVDYHKIVPLLVEAIKELSHKVEILEQKLQINN